MTWFEAESIRQDFVVNMRFAGISGKTKEEALKETAMKYTRGRLNEAYLALKRHSEEEIKTAADLFSLAMRAKKSGAA
jgi:hypothetical protein